MFVLWILSAWLENFLHSPCRYFSNTSALWKADSADFVAAQKQKHHSPFFVFVWEFKKEKKFTYTLQFVLSALHGGPLRSKVCI